MKYQVLKYLLLVFSCGFYNLPVHGFENPAHPRSAEEIQEENRREQDKYRPSPPCEPDDERARPENRDNWAIYD